MNKELEHIFNALPSEKHYVPNTISVLDKARNVLNVTAGQNANWTYANFFILDSDSPISDFSINEGQFVVAFRDGDWSIWDYNNSIVAKGLTEIESFVKKTSDAETLRLNHLSGKDNETTPFPLSTARPIIDEPLQIIYYGAPGTGKSYAIDNATAQYGSVRTTFHPDSDYASFVGAYKPTMEAVPINSIYGESVQYATGKNGHPGTEKKIVYKYVPQAFLKAYVAAWSDLDNPHYLVIEEINRGNCAQIFGDLFQLLDRNNSGSSSYAIHADDDIRQFLSTDSKGFAALSDEQKDAIRSFVLTKDSGATVDLGQKILDGELLLLPPNLRIWATMNTSDQSLFPIDSAFKRRWNWHYVPIEYDVKDWLLHVGDNYYRWGDFLRAINPIISELTESPDKQMGYFFAKPDEKHGDTQENNTISEDVFVNKVLFYLWTDVLKDFDAGKEPFLNTDTKRAYEFSDFFDSKHDYLEQFVGKLGISPIDGSEPVDEEATDKGSDYKSIEVSVDGQTETSMTKAMIAILQKAAPTHTFAEIEAAVSECITRGDDPIIKKIDNPAEYTKENRWNTTIIKSSDNICFVVTTMWQRQFLPMIKKLAQYFNVPFEVVNP